MRLLLVHLYKERITKSPPIQPLNRGKLNESDDDKLKEGFKLKRCGTVVRSIRGTNNTPLRMWEPLSSTVNHNDNLNCSSSSEKNLLLAEVQFDTKLN